jgi:hypothetical protein
MVEVRVTVNIAGDEWTQTFGLPQIFIGLEINTNPTIVRLGSIMWRRCVFGIVQEGYYARGTVIGRVSMEATTRDELIASLVSQGWSI